MFQATAGNARADFGFAKDNRDSVGAGKIFVVVRVLSWGWARKKREDYSEPPNACEETCIPFHTRGSLGMIWTKHKEKKRLENATLRIGLAAARRSAVSSGRAPAHRAKV